MSRLQPRYSCGKRAREEAVVAGEPNRMFANPVDHLLATPPRRMSDALPSFIPSNPFVGPVHSPRSPSICTTSGTDGGLSEDSVFILDISNHSCPASRRRASATTPSEAEISQWQRELNNFFVKLEERPLSVAPHSGCARSTV